MTFIVFCYNQSDFIEEAIQGALDQDYTPLQIIISDDCSIDKTFLIAQRIVDKYKGPHQITLIRNEENLGLIGHVNKVLGLAQGDLIIVSAGDDVSLPNRTKRIVDERFKIGKSLFLIHSDVLTIDKYGRELGRWSPPIEARRWSLAEIAVCEAIYIGASAAFSQSLINKFDPIKFKNAWEDLVWGFRASMLDALIYIPEPLVKYRVGVGISSDVDDRLCFKSMLRTHRHIRLVQIDVLEQRLYDVKSLHFYGGNEVAMAIKSQLNVEKIRFQLSLKPARTILFNSFINPVSLVKALFYDVRWMVNYVYNKIIQ